MAEQMWAVRDEIWDAAEPDPTAFNAIVFVVLTGIAGGTWRASSGSRRRPRTGAFRSASAPACGTSASRVRTALLPEGRP